MARTYNDIYYNDDENSTAEILDDMKKLAESVDQQIGSIKSFNNDTSQFIEQVTPLMNTLSEQVIDMHQLADTMFTELEQVKEENKQLREDLESDYEEKTVEGTDIEVNDSAEMRAKLKICGNHKQEVRSGKNLLPNEFEQGAWNGKENKTRLFNYSNIQLNTNTVYTFSTNLDITKYRYAISIASTKYPNTDNSNNLYDSGWQNAKQSYTFTTPEKNGYLGIAISTKNGTDDINLNSLAGVWFQVEKNSIATSFEQYGATPTPNIPSQIEAVGSNVNLYSGLESITFNRDSSRTTNVSLNLKAGTYTISAKFTNVAQSVSVQFLKRDKLVAMAENLQSNSSTITLSEDIDRLYFFLTSNAQSGYSTIMNKVKICKGTSTGEYSEYGQGCASVKIENENLYNINNKLVDAAIYSDGSIKAGQNNYLIYFKVKSGYKYVFSYTSENQINTNAIWGYSKEKPKMGGKATYNIISVKSLNNYIFEPKSDDNYLLLRLNYISQLNLMNNIQLKKSTDSKNYVSYQEQSFIMPTQKEMLEEDYFDTKNYKEVHNWKKIVLNGSETYTAGGSSNEVYRYDAQILINSAKVDKNKMVCTHFKSVYQDLNFYEHIRNSTKENPTAIVFYIKGKKTLTEFKAWLRQQYEAETPVTIYYKLTTPEQIEMTLEQKRVSDEIEKAKSYYETTIVTSEDEIQPNLEFTYKRSNKLRVENLEKALLSQGGGV